MRETLTITSRIYSRSQRKLALVAHRGGEIYSTLVLYRDLPHWREVARGWLTALADYFDISIFPQAGEALSGEEQ